MGKTLTLLAALLRTARLRARPGAAEERGRRRSACRAAGEVACVDGGGTLIVSPGASTVSPPCQVTRQCPVTGISTEGRSCRCILSVAEPRVSRSTSNPGLSRIRPFSPITLTGRLPASATMSQ